MLPLAVTVTAKHPHRYVDEAKARAAEWGLPFVERVKPLPADRAWFVLGHDGWTFRDGPHVLRFTPGLSVVRIKRLGAAHQQQDVLIRVCELGPGDTVFDGTFGLGVDALVCARVVGPTGKVIASEASRVLYLLASEALKRTGLSELVKAPGGDDVGGNRDGPIELHHGTSREILSAMPARSVDCVVFDPMFDVPKASTTTFDLMRRYAVHEPLDLDTINEARRVARRWVVVKSGRYGNELSRLGLEQVHVNRHSPTVWGRIGPSLTEPVEDGPAR